MRIKRRAVWLTAMAAATLSGLTARAVDTVITGVNTFPTPVGGGDTVLILGTPGVNALANQPTGFSNFGLIQLNSTGTGNAQLRISDVDNGPMVNEVGARLEFLRTVMAGNANRILDGELINDGSVLVADGALVSFVDANAIHVNTGAFSIESGGSLTVDAASQTFRHEGGTIDNQGAFTVNNATFAFLGGTITGNPIVVMNSGAFNFGDGMSGAGEVVIQNGNHALVGTALAADTVLSIRGIPSLNTQGIHTAGFTSHGTINLQSTGTGAPTLTVTGGPLVNSISGELNFQTGTGVLTRTLNASLTNDGVVNVEADTNVSTTLGGAQITNNNQFNVAAGGAFTVSTSSQTFTQAAGTLDNQGSFIVNNATFRYLDGNITGNPIIVTNTSTFDFGDGMSGTGEVVIQNGNHALVGTVLAADTIMTIRGIPSLNTNAIHATGFTSHGTINLQSTGSGAPTLTVTGGPLVNSISGKLNFQTGTGVFARTLNASLTNDGVVNVEADTNVTTGLASGVLINNNQFNVAATGAFTVNASSQTFTQAAGTLDNQGSFIVNNATFRYLDGNITGNPIIVTNTSTFDFGDGMSGAGEVVIQNGNHALVGTVLAADTIMTIRGIPSLNTNGIHATGFTNHGTINLQSTGSGAPTLTVITGGTLVNSATGRLNFQTGTGVINRTLTASLTNDGVVSVEADTNVSTTLANAQITNNNQFNVAAAGTFTVNSSGQTFTQAGGTLDNQGSFIVNNATFRYLDGNITGNPIIVTNTSTFDFGDGMSGTGEVVIQNGNHAIVGTVLAADTIMTIRGIPSLNTQGIHTAGFTSHGTINLQSTGSGAPTLTVTGGPLVNSISGKLNFQTGTGVFARTLNASLTNDGVVNVEADTNVVTNLSNAQLTNNNQFNVAAGGAFTVSTSGQAFTQAGGILDNQGSFTVNNATFRYLGGNITGNAVVVNNTGAFDFGNGMSGTGEVIIQVNSHTLTGTDLASQTMMTVRGTPGNNTAAAHAGSFANRGTINLTTTGSGAPALNAAGTLTNHNLIHVQAGTNATGRTLGVELDNRAMLDVDLSMSLGRTGANHVNSGTIDLANATVTVTGATLTNQASGVIRGTGGFNVASTTFTNNGLLTPGMSAGTIAVTGTYNQGDTGRLRIEVGSDPAGGNFDRLTVTVDANLDGHLQISRFNGYTGQFGHVFNVIEIPNAIAGNVVSGVFDTIGGLDAGNGLLFATIYGNKTVSLRPTIPGDLNVDGTVNITDLAQLAANFGGTPGAVWAAGDVTGDGRVTITDLSILATFFGQSVGGGGATGAAGGDVPLPATMLLLPVLAAAVRPRRNRR